MSVPRFNLSQMLLRWMKKLFDAIIISDTAMKLLRLYLVQTLYITLTKINNDYQSKLPQDEPYLSLLVLI